jgi:hypothetical protein
MGSSQHILENRCTHIILANNILWTTAVQRCPMQYIVQYTIHLVTKQLSWTTKLLSLSNTQYMCIKKLWWHYILHSFIQYLSETAAIVLKLQSIPEMHRHNNYQRQQKYSMQNIVYNPFNHTKFIWGNSCIKPENWWNSTDISIGKEL